MNADGRLTWAILLFGAVMTLTICLLTFWHNHERAVVRRPEPVVVRRVWSPELVRLIEATRPVPTPGRKVAE